MTRRRKDPLRHLTDIERRELHRLRRSSAAPAAQVARAAALLLVNEGLDYQEAARAVGRKSGDAVSHLVARFNQEGLTARTTAARRRPGGGLRRGGSRPHPAGGRTDAHSGAGRDGDLVPLDPAARAAFGPRRPAARLDLHPVAGIARGRIQPPADPHLVPDLGGARCRKAKDGHGHGPGRRAQKKLIEDAYRLGESLGLAVWCCDQAGPFLTVPHPGQAWRPEGDPARQPHEYIRNGTAKGADAVPPRQTAGCVSKA